MCLYYNPMKNKTFSNFSPAQNPSYLISVSEVLRCGVPTTLSVSVLADYPIKVTAELLHGNSSVAQTESTIPAGKSPSFDFLFTELQSLLCVVFPPQVFSDDMSYWYPYQLDVKGFVGANQVFSNSTTMVFSPKCMSIFIQTDKNNYRPGQTVKFRVVSVTPEGKPSKGQIDIFIRDPKGNMIRQWLSVDGFLGVVSKELNLSQNPPLGLWKIVAGINVSSVFISLSVGLTYNSSARVSIVKNKYNLEFLQHPQIIKPSTTFTAQVMSRGQVLDAGTVHSSSFSLNTDHSWTPVACVVVYHTLPDGEIVNDALQVTFTQVLRNTVRVHYGIFTYICLEIQHIHEKTMVLPVMSSLFILIFSLKLICSTAGAELYLNQLGSEAFQEPRKRKDFPETWIWLDANVSNSVSDSFHFTVPDSLTSWVAFAIVMSENMGLGISAPAELTVFRDFFVSLNLPEFLIRGELLLLEVNLFNYMDADLEVRFVFPSLLPEGLEQSFTQTLFLEFQLKQKTLTRTMSFSFPPNVVPDSQRASVSAVGDILGPSIDNLDSLIEMPYGCGEQNMIHFAPNIYVLQYMRSTKQSDEQTRNKAMSYMMEAYERELSYQRFDGSFSAFGDSDDSGSTWLSAFVLRCFLQAQDFISIDLMVMQRTAYWLLAHQNPDGSFNEPGRVIHTELQGGLNGPVSLTAYVLIAISSAVSFLTSRLAQGISSNYSLSLVTYALSLANSTAGPSALTELLNRALIVDGVPTWRSPANVLYNSWQPSSSDIEMSAYVLLAMHRLKLMDEGFTLVKWLSKEFFQKHRYNYLLQQSQDLPVLSKYFLGSLWIFDGITFDQKSVLRLRENQGLRQTGMAILDVGLLSGFSLAQNGVQLNDIVRRVETPSGRVILYLDTYCVLSLCVEISTIQDFKVTNVQDAVVMIYDYYEPRRRTVRSYTSETRQDMSVCSLCGPDCSECGVRDVWPTDRTTSINQHPLLALSLTTALVILLSIYN
uniref:CD109 molecule n=1 Tax=Sinocyclocheilus rhinocerous TaxID=307959 RepID=A0A673I028_9TELE